MPDESFTASSSDFVSVDYACVACKENEKYPVDKLRALRALWYHCVMKDDTINVRIYKRTWKKVKILAAKRGYKAVEMIDELVASF